MVGTKNLWSGTGAFGVGDSVGGVDCSSIGDGVGNEKVGESDGILVGEELTLGEPVGCGPSTGLRDGA